MTYKYALLRSTENGLVVDFNEMSEKEFNDKLKDYLINQNKYDHEKAIQDWKSSHLTIPVDKGQKRFLRTMAWHTHYNDYPMKQPFIKELKQGIVLNPELLEVRETVSWKHIFQNLNPEKFVFLREEKKLTYTEGGIKGENGVINVITQNGVRYIREGYQEQPAELPTDKWIEKECVEFLGNTESASIRECGAKWMRDHIQSNSH